MCLGCWLITVWYTFPSEDGSCHDTLRSPKLRSVHLRLTKASVTGRCSRPCAESLLSDTWRFWGVISVSSSGVPSGQAAAHCRQHFTAFDTTCEPQMWRFMSDCPRSFLWAFSGPCGIELVFKPAKKRQMPLAFHLVGHLIQNKTR